jgi:hypothetical protein
VASTLHICLVEVSMSLKDKLEIGLKPDAPYREDNLPEFQQDDPACQEGGEPGDTADKEAAREACDTSEGLEKRVKARRNRRRAPVSDAE